MTSDTLMHQSGLKTNFIKQTIRLRTILSKTVDGYRDEMRHAYLFKLIPHEILANIFLADHSVLGIPQAKTKFVKNK